VAEDRLNSGIASWELIERSFVVKQRKILVADDDRITREIIGSILIKDGHEVVFAEDGKSAVELASSEKPDLVFIDGLMPKMHGFLACKAIKELESPPKVILLTGIYTKPSYKWEAKESFNADDLLKKPCGPDELSACIEKHLPSESFPEHVQAESVDSSPRC
jgi:twitching motility two-component system response regulator PilH